MIIKNINNREPYIFHFAGHSMKWLNNIVYNYIDKKIINDDRITILTLFTNRSLSMLSTQLEYSNIQYVNCINIEYKGFFMHKDKMAFYINELKKVTTPYVLILDAYDVLINKINGLVDDFEKLNCDMLFNSCFVRYPNINIENEPNDVGRYNQFNSGVCMAKTKSAIKFYEEACELSKEISKNDKLLSEQYVFRHLLLKTDLNIIIDYKCDYFCCTPGMLFNIFDDIWEINYKNNEKTDSNFYQNIKKFNIDLPIWANGYDFNNIDNNCDLPIYYVYTMLKELERIKPNNILELGISNCSILLHKYCKTFGAKYFIAEQFNNNIKIDKILTKTDEPLNLKLYEVFKDKNISYYIDLENDIKNNIDFISIRGPFGFDCEMPRINIINIINKKMMNENGVIMLYDYQRKGEQNLINELKKYIMFDLYIPDTIYPFALLKNIKYKTDNVI